MCLNIGTPNNHHFPFGTNEKVVVLGVPILRHFRVYMVFIWFIRHYSPVIMLWAGMYMQSSKAGPEVIKLFFSCSTHEILNAHKYKNIKKFGFF